MHRTFDEAGNLIAEDRGTVPLHAGAFDADGTPLDGPTGRASAAEQWVQQARDAQADSADAVNDGVDKTTDRQAEIMAAVVMITRRADPGEFTADRKPRIETIRSITGFDITAAERDQALANLQQDED